MTKFLIMWRPRSVFFFALAFSTVNSFSFVSSWTTRVKSVTNNVSFYHIGGTITNEIRCQIIMNRYLYSSMIHRHPTVAFSQPNVENSKSLVQSLEDAGQRLMPMALEAKEKSIILRTQSHPQDKKLRVKTLLYSLKSCALFSLFILYRAYRGFFVLLPAVFRQSYAKLKMAVDSPFTEDTDNASLDDINPKTGQVRLRTRVVVSILSLVVVSSFVINGALEVLFKFLSTIRRTSSIENSFEAAAEEVLINEDKVQRYTTKKGRLNGGSFRD